jgi:hypothetical protein
MALHSVTGAMAQAVGDRSRRFVRSHWLTRNDYDRTLSSSRTLPMALHSVTGAATQEIGDRAGVGLLHRCSGCSSAQLAIAAIVATMNAIAQVSLQQAHQLPL